MRRAGLPAPLRTVRQARPGLRRLQPESANRRAGGLQTSSAWAWLPWAWLSSLPCAWSPMRLRPRRCGAWRICRLQSLQQRGVLRRRALPRRCSLQRGQALGDRLQQARLKSRRRKQARTPQARPSRCCLAMRRRLPTALRQGRTPRPWRPRHRRRQHPPRRTRQACRRQRSRRLRLRRQRPGRPARGRRLGLLADAQARPLSGLAGLWHRSHQVAERRIEVLLHRRQRLQQAVPAGSELLHLCPPAVTLAAQVAQHALAHGLGFLHHVSALPAGVLEDAGCLPLGIGYELVSLRCALGPKSVGLGGRLVAQLIGCRRSLLGNRGGFAFGPFRPLGGCDVGGLDHLTGLHPQSRSHTLSLEQSMARPGQRLGGLGETGAQLVAGAAQLGDLRSGTGQQAAYLRGIEATPHNPKGGVLERQQVDRVAGRHRRRC